MPNVAKIESYDIRALALPYGKLDATSTSTVMTAQIPNITELYDGLMILLKNGVVTSASGFTLNINGLGAKPCYQNIAAATRLTTGFNINYTYLFIYDETRVDGGCWIVYYGYYTNSDTTTTGYMRQANASFKPTTSLTRYKICLTKNESEVIPVTTVSNSTATTKALTTDTFNPFAPIYYYSTTTTVAAGAAISVSYLWTAHPSFSLLYSFNTGSTLVSQKDIYIRAVLTDGIKATLATDPITQELPTSDDGFIYIKLGHAVSTSNIALTYDHPIYVYKGGAVRTLSGYADTVGSINGHTLGTDVPEDAVFTDTKYIATGETIGSASAGTAIAADDITAWTTNTPTAVTKKTVVTAASGATAAYANGILTITNGSFTTGDSVTVTAGKAASLSYTERSIPNISVTQKAVITGIKAT